MPDWGKNSSMMETLIRLKGGNEIIAQIIGENDIKKRVWLINKYIEWARKVGIDVPE